MCCTRGTAPTPKKNKRNKKNCKGEKGEEIKRENQFYDISEGEKKGNCVEEEGMQESRYCTKKQGGPSAAEVIHLILNFHHPSMWIWMSDERLDAF